MTPRQYALLRWQWQRHQQDSRDMLAHLRADLRNAWLPKSSKAPWTPEELGATKTTPRKYGPKKWSPEEFRQRVVSQFGPDGKGLDQAGKPGSALAALRGKGQPIPMPKRA